MGSIPRITLSDSSKSSLFSFGDLIINNVNLDLQGLETQNLKLENQVLGLELWWVSTLILFAVYVHVYVIILCIAAPTESLTHSNSDKLSFGSESPLVPAHDSDTNISYGFGY